jgi:hypothetical protein
MITKSRIGAIAFIAAIDVATLITAICITSPSFAQRTYGQSYTSGSSAGYPVRNPDPWANDYRLNHHQSKHHSTSKAHSD